MNEENNVTNNYLMLLNIKNPQPEHARILGKLSELSNETAKAIYFDRHGGAFLMSTSLDANSIYKKLDGIVFNDDSFLIIEIGSDWMTFGNNIASYWLKIHNIR